MAPAGKRAGAHDEGLVGYIVDDARGSIVGIGCETEPVSKNEEFQDFAQRVLRRCTPRARAVEGFEQERQELIAKLGENIVIVGAERFDAETATRSRGTRILRRTRSASSSAPGRIGRARRPGRDAHRLRGARVGHARDGSAREVVEAERAIYLNSDEVQSKPEAAREKIVDGMLGKRFFAATPAASSPTRPGCTMRPRPSRRRSTRPRPVVAFTRVAVVTVRSRTRTRGSLAATSPRTSGGDALPPHPAEALR